MVRLAVLLSILLFLGCDSENVFNSDSNPVLLDQIALQYQNEEIEEARTKMLAYLKKYPKDDLAWTILGNMYQDLDDYEKAQNAYDKAVKINPRRVEALTGLGVLHRKNGNNEEAMRAYEKSVAINPEYAQAYSSMVTIALMQHEDQKALEYGEKAYQLDKEDPVIAANLAIAYHYNDDFANRDKLTLAAKKLGYKNLDILDKIYSGEMTIRDE